MQWSAPPFTSSPAQAQQLPLFSPRTHCSRQQDITVISVCFTAKFIVASAKSQVFQLTGFSRPFGYRPGESFPTRTVCAKLTIVIPGAPTVQLQSQAPARSTIPVRTQTTPRFKGWTSSPPPQATLETLVSGTFAVYTETDQNTRLLFQVCFESQKLKA